MVTFVAAARTWLACAFRRFASLFLRMIWSKNRTPLFGIMRGGGDFFLAWWWLAKLGRDCAARTIFHAVIASGSEAIQSLRGKLDCFVALLLAMMNEHPPPRSETNWGRGTTRRVVEGACGGRASGKADAPSTALRAVPLSRFAGQDEATAPRNDEAGAGSPSRRHCRLESIQGASLFR